MSRRHGVDLQVQVRASGGVLEAWTVHDDDPLAVNTQEAPDRVAPQSTPSAVLKHGVLHARLPPAFWSARRLGRSS